MLGVKVKGLDATSRSLELDRYKELSRLLHHHFGFSLVATTLRESQSASANRWSGLLLDGQAFYESLKYDIRIVDRVGRGDAFSGGLFYGILLNMCYQKMIDFATAASCLKHSIHGDFNLVSRQEVEDLIISH
jgi:2-dehydro-3-deoxygluconokinase